jgi:hypothetical protein
VLRLQLSPAVDLDHFCDFLRAVQVEIEQIDEHVLHIGVPGAISDEHERRELTGYVTTWNALHPGLRVEIL